MQSADRILNQLIGFLPATLKHLWVCCPRAINCLKRYRAHQCTISLWSKTGVKLKSGVFTGSAPASGYLVNPMKRFPAFHGYKWLLIYHNYSFTIGDGLGCHCSLGHVSKVHAPRSAILTQVLPNTKGHRTYLTAADSKRGKVYKV